MATIPSPFDPLQLGPITLRNRFIKSGANEGMVVDGAPSKALVKHHRDLAAGGVGMSTAAYGAVSSIGRTLPNQVWIRPDIIPDLKALADAVHAEGGKMSYQLTHGGLFVTGIKVQGRLMSACSGFNKAGLLSGNWWSRAMNEDDMAQVIGEFAAAARVCREAGLDAVELHMGHGYLLNQFLSPFNNKRRDQYGGSAENRARFPAAVLAAVKAAVGKDMAVLAKINVSDGVKGGATVEDAIVTANILDQAGADMLVLSGGRNVESGAFMFGSNHNVEEMEKVLGKKASIAFKLSQFGAPKVTFKEMYFLEYSRQIRAATKVALGYLGGAKSLANAQTAMQDGFEAVVMARALIHDTGLVNKFKSGELTQSGCTNCNRCVPYIYHPAGTWCVMNPPNDPALNRVRAAA
ncbi:NADH:flavin oxidoreductase [Denitratisoma oestradiolicum]|uniref:Flavin oxidoreductase n=1 Tax=Denitratisoma oestradiolicum TaxID=311182 RepID=A0A6S6XV02_9PROT|nr:NADH:flavin oxidoreductase [Denitratisoma oestradiolicum]TWO80044.1 flavin oxidoreductase [Denitratisoma oestradiolicum]CAB1369817.1 Flavin oxidoreductase [Denitratisoma oestradiolicum]